MKYLLILFLITNIYSQSYDKENIIPLTTPSSTSSLSMETETFQSEFIKAVKFCNCSALLRYINHGKSKINETIMDIKLFKELIDNLHKKKYDVLKYNIEKTEVINKTETTIITIQDSNSISLLKILLESEKGRLFIKLIKELNTTQEEKDKSGVKNEDK